MKPVEIAKNIFWVGAVDWNCRNFHGYSRSPNGTTYNAFLIKDEKNVLVDTVKDGSCSSLACSVAGLIDPEKIDYIVVNHLEPDHSGCLPQMVERIKPEKIFISPMGAKSIETFHDSKDWPLEVVESGAEVSIGQKTLKFLETKMIHWPDNMFTYIPQDKLLISSDAFGQNWASSERFADQVDKARLWRLMSDYYANIVLPYSSRVIKALDSLAELGIEVETLCPDHGLLLRGPDVKATLDLYRDLANQKQSRKAVIVYDTMWKSTEKMAESIASGLAEEGVSVRVMSVKANHHSDIMSEVMDAAALIVGSPTHNNGLLPGVAETLTYIKGLRPENKIGAAFGSFGWSGECVKILEQWLTEAKIEIAAPAVKVKNKPGHDVFGQCFELGREIGRKIKERVSE